MDVKNLESIKSDLQTRRAKLNFSLNLLLEDKHRPLTQNLDDQSIAEENDDVIDALEIKERIEINKIDNALKRLRSGTFGICLECGTKIHEKRLRALPYSTTCIDCAT